MASQIIRIPRRRHATREASFDEPTIIPPRRNESLDFRLPKNPQPTSRHHNNHRNGSHSHGINRSSKWSSSSATTSRSGSNSSETAPPTPVTRPPLTHVLVSRDEVEERVVKTKRKAFKGINPSVRSDNEDSPLSAAIRSPALLSPKPSKNDKLAEIETLPATSISLVKLSGTSMQTALRSASQTRIQFNADEYKTSLADHFLKEPLSSALTSPAFHEVIDRNETGNSVTFRLPTASRSPIRGTANTSTEDPLSLLFSSENKSSHSTSTTINLPSSSPSAEHHVRAAKALMHRMMEEAMASLEQNREKKSNTTPDKRTSLQTSSSIVAQNDSMKSVVSPQKQQHIRHSAVLAFINMCKDYNVPEDVTAAHSQILANTMQNAMDAFGELHRRKSDERVAAFEEQMVSAIQSQNNSRSSSPVRHIFRSADASNNGGFGNGIVTSKDLPGVGSIFYPGTDSVNVSVNSHLAQKNSRAHSGNQYNDCNTPIASRLRTSSNSQQSHEAPGIVSNGNPSMARNRFEYQQLAVEDKNSRSPSSAALSNSKPSSRSQSKSKATLIAKPSVVSPRNQKRDAQLDAEVHTVTNHHKDVSNSTNDYPVSSSSPSPSPPKSRIPSAALVHTFSSATKVKAVKKEKPPLVSLLYASNGTDFVDCKNSTSKLSAMSSSSALRALDTIVKNTSKSSIKRPSSAPVSVLSSSLNSNKQGSGSKQVLSSESNMNKSQTHQQVKREIAQTKSTRLLAEKAFLVQRMHEADEKKKQGTGLVFRSGSTDTPHQQVRSANWNGSKSSLKALLSSSDAGSLDHIFKVKLQPDYLKSAGNSSATSGITKSRKRTSSASDLKNDQVYQLEQQRSVLVASSRTSSTTTLTTHASSVAVPISDSTIQTSAAGTTTGLVPQSLSGSIVMVPQTANRWQKLTLPKSGTAGSVELAAGASSPKTVMSRDGSFALIPSMAGSFAVPSQQAQNRSGIEEIDKGSMTSQTLASAGLNQSMFSPTSPNFASATFTPSHLVSNFQLAETVSKTETDAEAWRRSALQALNEPIISSAQLQATLMVKNRQTSVTLPDIALSEIIPPQLPLSEHTNESDGGTGQHVYPFSDNFLQEAQRQIEETRTFIHNGFVNANQHQGLSFPVPLQRQTPFNPTTPLPTAPPIETLGRNCIEMSGLRNTTMADAEATIVATRSISKGSTSFLVPALSEGEQVGSHVEGSSTYSTSSKGETYQNVDNKSTTTFLSVAIPDMNLASEDLNYGIPVRSQNKSPSARRDDSHMSHAVTGNSSHQPRGSFPRATSTDIPHSPKKDAVPLVIDNTRNEYQYMTPPSRGRSSEKHTLQAKNLEEESEDEYTQSPLAAVPHNALHLTSYGQTVVNQSKRSKKLPSATTKMYNGFAASPQPAIDHHHHHHHHVHGRPSSQNRALSGQSTFGYVSSSTDSDSETDELHQHRGQRMHHPNVREGSCAESVASDYDSYFNAEDSSEQPKDFSKVGTSPSKNRYRFAEQRGFDVSGNGPIGSNPPSVALRFNIPASPMPVTARISEEPEERPQLSSPPTVWGWSSREPVDSNINNQSSQLSPSRFAVATSLADNELLRKQHLTNAQMISDEERRSDTRTNASVNLTTGGERRPHLLSAYLTDRNHNLRKHFGGGGPAPMEPPVGITTTTSVMYSEERSSGSPDREMRQYNSSRRIAPGDLRTVTTSQSAITTRSVTPTSRSISPATIGGGIHVATDRQTTSGGAPEWLINALARKKNNSDVISEAISNPQNRSQSTLNASQNVIGATAVYAPPRGQQQGRFALPSRLTQPSI